MNKIAIYSRLSLEDYQKKNESESISNQREYIKSYIRGHKELVEYETEEYADDGFSGTNPNRPAYQRLLENIKDNRISIIIVKDMSRFSRDYIEMGNFLENIFPFMGIRFISINDSYDSFIEGNNGTELDTQFKSLLYDFYSKDLSQKMRSVSSVLKSQGKNTNGLAPFGYLKSSSDKYKIIVDDKTAFIVKEAFELILQGYSCREIAVLFNEKGYITRSGRKEELGITNYRKSLRTGTEIKERKWTSTAVSQLTCNELYTGDYVYNKYKETRIGKRKKEKLLQNEWKRIKNSHEPIISKEVFNQVQKIKEKSKGENFNNKVAKKDFIPIFQRKIFCKECGSSMHYRREKHNSIRGTYFYKSYYCTYCKQNKRYNNVKEKAVEDVLLTELKNIPVLINEEKGENDIFTKQNYIEELENINRSLQMEYERYKKKELSKEAYLQEKEKLLIRKQEIEKAFKKDKATFKKQKSSSLSVDKGSITKELVEAMVERIVVSREGRIEINIKKC